MTDNTQELDEILRDYEFVRHTDCDDSCGNKSTEAEAKRAILDWHNKQVEEMLDRLLEHGEDFTTFGDAGRSVAVEYIEAERNKLKESSND